MNKWINPDPSHCLCPNPNQEPLNHIALTLNNILYYF